MPNSCALTCHARFALGVLPNHTADGDLNNWTEDSDQQLAEWLWARWEELWGGHEDGEGGE